MSNWSYRVVLGDSGTIPGTLNADLTGATARLNLRAPSGDTFTLPATVGLNGSWSATYADDDFTEQGRHDAEVEVTYSDGAVQTFQWHSSNQRLSVYVGSQVA